MPEDFSDRPDIESLTDGVRVSVAVGYCASVAASAFRGEALPDNIVFHKSEGNEYPLSGIIYINTGLHDPLPFNQQAGQIIMGGIWDTDDKGVISILFADVHISNGKSAIYGLYTVPVIRQDEDNFLTLFAREDIIIGEGSDTILFLSYTQPRFEMEIDRTDTEQPDELFTAVKQNVWFVNIDQCHTPSDFSDDSYTINGGGQMAEVDNTSAGIVYHAVVNTLINIRGCNKNPLSGQAMVQHFKAGDNMDFRTILLQFNECCDGKAMVTAATGSYFRWNNHKIALGL